MEMKRMEQRNLVIIGNGSYSQMLKKYMESTRFGNVVSYAADRDVMDKSEIDGIPVISMEDLKERYPVTEIALVMGVGYSHMSTIRKDIFYRCKDMGYDFVNYVHPNAYIAPNVQMGEGNNFFEFTDIQMDAKIGNANLFLAGSFLGHDCQVKDFNTFGVKSAISGFVTIGSNCFFGTSSTVKHRLSIGDYVFVGATGYAHKNLKNYKIVMPKPDTFLDGEKDVYMI